MRCGLTNKPIGFVALANSSEGTKPCTALTGVLLVGAGPVGGLLATVDLLCCNNIVDAPKCQVTLNCPSANCGNLDEAGLSEC